MNYLHALRQSSYFCLVVACAFTWSNCYTFSGASVPQHWKSVTIPLFEDESNFGQPALREKVTSLLIEKFQRDNTLQVTDRGNASVELRGKIIAIEADQPTAVAQGTQASRLRVDVKVSVILFDNQLKKQAWSKTFSASGDYAPSGGTTERDAGLQKAIEKLTDDLLLETISAW
jgi:hypothetical protein